MDRTGYERAGTAYDPDAVGHELQGRDQLCCSRCAKRLSRKTARIIDGKPLCSACMFAPRQSIPTRSAKTP